MDIEKLVEECDALILNCSGDTRMMARAVIRCTLEAQAQYHATLVGEFPGLRTTKEAWHSDEFARLRSLASTLENSRG